ncbi:MAG: hypothetical protein ABIJ56_10060 [Pseudomonadota bacterium]
MADWLKTDIARRVILGGAGLMLLLIFVLPWQVGDRGILVHSWHFMLLGLHSSGTLTALRLSLCLPAGFILLVEAGGTASDSSRAWVAAAVGAVLFIWPGGYHLSNSLLIDAHQPGWVGMVAVAGILLGSLGLVLSRTSVAPVWPRALATLGSTTILTALLIPVQGSSILVRIIANVAVETSHGARLVMLVPLVVLTLPLTSLLAWWSPAPRRSTLILGWVAAAAWPAWALLKPAAAFAAFGLGWKGPLDPYGAKPILVYSSLEYLIGITLVLAGALWLAGDREPGERP